MKSGTKFFYCIKCAEIFEADHKVRKKVLRPQNFLRKVSVSKYHKTYV